LSWLDCIQIILKNFENVWLYDFFFWSLFGKNIRIFTFGKKLRYLCRSVFFCTKSWLSFTDLLHLIIKVSDLRWRNTYLWGKNSILIKSIIGELLGIIKIHFMVITLIMIFYHTMIWLGHIIRLLIFSMICIKLLIILILFRFFINCFVWILTITLWNPMIMTDWIEIRSIRKIMRSHWLTDILICLVMKISRIIKRIKVSLVCIIWTWMIIFINKRLWSRIDVIMGNLIGLSCNQSVTLISELRLIINWSLIWRLGRRLIRLVCDRV